MNWLRSFMQGRYGMDKLNQVLSRLIMVILILQLIIRSSSLYLVTGLLIILIYSRCLSKNHYRRLAENKKFETIWIPVEKWFRIRLRQIKEIRTHKYFTCSQCRQEIRVPRKKGALEICCPKCRNHFKAKT